MELESEKLSNIVASNANAAMLFSQYGLDYCCKGAVTLDEACKHKGLNTDKMVHMLEDVLSQPVAHDFNHMPIDELIDHIVSVHHGYAKNTMPILLNYFEKLCRIHGDQQPELFRIYELLTESFEAINTHMFREEVILFPYIKEVVAARRAKQPMPGSGFKNIENPLSMLEEEHAGEGARFERIAELSHNFNYPVDACQTYRVAYEFLNEFRNDLHKHIHLENNILFARVRALCSSKPPQG